MKKILYRILIFVSAFALTITTFSSVRASYNPALPIPINKRLTVANSTGLSFETSGTVEKITTTADGWTMQAGGNVASTHYARAKYKLPEVTGAVFTYFYVKAVIVLPADFYTQQTAGFRILNSDNYPTLLNGVSVGAANANELRVSIYVNSDHKLRVLVDHETGTVLTLYTAPSILPTGEHTFELSGDVANNMPWYLKIDGAVVASGTRRLSTDDMLDSERVITRIVTGIDGAADQDNNPVNLTVKSLEIANYDVSGVTATTVPPTATKVSTVAATPTATNPSIPSSTPTAIVVPPSFTATQKPFTATASPLPIIFTSTMTTVPTVIFQPTDPIIVSPGTGSVDIRVASGSDDVEESSSGAMSIDSGDLELIYYQGIQVVGVRFTGVNIPKGAVITNAYIQFKVDEVSSKSIKLAISGEASPNAAAFSTSARNVSKRLKTSNKVTWSPVSWTKAGEMGKSQRTSNIKSIVQEIVNQSGWGAGNSLVIIITGSNSGARIAKSFDGDKSGAPILHIEFSIPTLVTVASPTSTLTMTTTATLVPATVPATFTPIPTEVITIPTIVVTATEIVAPTDTPVPTLVPPYPTETPVPIVP